MIKKLLSALLTTLLTLSLAACNKDDSGKVDIPANQTGSEEFQKNMHQSNTHHLLYVCETESGFYFLRDAYAYYIDKGTKKATILCGKPECEHKGRACNAWLNARSLWFSGGKLYFSNSDAVEERGTYVDYGNRLYSVEANGTNRRVVQNLELEPGKDTALVLSCPIMHRNVTYFAYRGCLYALPQGGDAKEAERIWGEEREGQPGGVPIFDSNEIAYELWADGDFVYFMVNLQQPDGLYKDTLFAYNTVDKSTAQVWAAPDESEVGAWETTGVSVTQWYVMNGAIFFSLSGNDFWKTDLTTGETVKLANTHEKTLYGSAVFSNEYMCLLNDYPDPQLAGMTSVLGGVDHIGGDTIYVYGLDGHFIKELSLTGLYEKSGNLEACELAFCADGDIYFIADAGRYGPTGYIRDLTLCCVSIDTGEITEIYNWQ